MCSLHTGMDVVMCYAIAKVPSVLPYVYSVCLSLPSSPFSLRAAADQIKWTVHQVSFASHSRCELSPESTAQSLSPFRCPLTVAVLATAPRLCSCRSREEEERLQSFGVKDGTGAVDTRGPGSNARSAVDNQW